MEEEGKVHLTSACHSSCGTWGQWLISVLLSSSEIEVGNAIDLEAAQGLSLSICGKGSEHRLDQRDFSVNVSLFIFIQVLKT